VSTSPGSEMSAGQEVVTSPGRARSDSRSQLLAVLVALCGPLAASAVMILVRSHVANTGLALIMVAVVVATVAPGRRAAAVIAGISAGVWFDFFLTKPYESFTMSRSADQETTILLVVVAVAVGEIAARNRRHHIDTVAAWADLAGMSTITRMLAGNVDADEIVDAVRAELTSLLFLESCRFDPTGRERRAPYLDREGTVDYNQFSRDTAREGLPDKDVTLAVEAGGQMLGRYVLRGPALGVPIRSDRLHTAVVLSDLVGVALDRARHPGSAIS
jgi:K+-sensing histidine kinase KdpD